MLLDPSAEVGAQGGGGRGRKPPPFQDGLARPTKGSADSPWDQGSGSAGPPPFGTPLGSGAVGSPPRNLSKFGLQVLFQR